MLTQTATFLVGSALFDVDATLDQSPSHTPETPDKRIVGWVATGRSLDDAIAGFHIMTTSERLLFLDGRRNRYKIVAVVQETARIRFVAELIRPRRIAVMSR